MPFTPHGKHMIAGDWTDAPETFTSSPATGPGHSVSQGSTQLVDLACTAAEEAFAAYGSLQVAERAAFLETIADEIDKRGADITEIGTRESGLPAARLEGERGRTTGQLRLFADHIRAGAYLDLRHDPALPDRTPPRPDLRMIQRPIGPIAVFGASNFPLAFSTAGGDTAAALAAGCTVVVKGHEAHPGTAEIVAEAIAAAVRACGLPAGVFSLVHGGSREVGQALVSHPLIRAVGFTGSLAAGRALFDLCAARPEPIPFFGELGSVNPVFVLPGAAGARGTQIAEGWAASLCLGAGQFCTNPGVLVIEAGAEADAFVAAVQAALSKIGPQVMLTEGIAEAFARGRKELASCDAVTTLAATDSGARTAAPCLFETDARAWMDTPLLREEVFGPLGMIVRTSGPEESAALAASLDGQLTATLHCEASDASAARGLLAVLERKAGRVLVNGFPTGVEVADAMVHGGPYPASTNFGATSVGTLAIRRFLRPVCYQDLPDYLMPADLADPAVTG